MSNITNTHDLFEALQKEADANPAFRAQLEANPNDAVYALTGKHLSDYAPLETELADNDLEAVAGGIQFPIINTDWIKDLQSTCQCRPPEG